jgi:hypothetical protein
MYLAQHHPRKHLRSTKKHTTHNIFGIPTPTSNSTVAFTPHQYLQLHLQSTINMKASQVALIMAMSATTGTVTMALKDTTRARTAISRARTAIYDFRESNYGDDNQGNYGTAYGSNEKYGDIKYAYGSNDEYGDTQNAYGEDKYGDNNDAYGSNDKYGDTKDTHGSNDKYGVGDYGLVSQYGGVRTSGPTPKPTPRPTRELECGLVVCLMNVNCSVFKEDVYDMSLRRIMQDASWTNHVCIDNHHNYYMLAQYQSGGDLSNRECCVKTSSVRVPISVQRNVYAYAASRVDAAIANGQFSLELASADCNLGHVNGYSLGMPGANGVLVGKGGNCNNDNHGPDRRLSVMSNVIVEAFEVVQVEPTASPTQSLTTLPSLAPTVVSTLSPTVSQTASPTIALIPEVLTSVPTQRPTVLPSATPIDSEMPTMPSDDVSILSPTTLPTSSSVSSPTVTPTLFPTAVYTLPPSLFPTALPISSPTVPPSSVPTGVPTMSPTEPPSLVPTAVPTLSPTEPPSSVPTVVPTMSPTTLPTPPPIQAPTVPPSSVSTAVPTASPTEHVPEDILTFAPTGASDADYATATTVSVCGVIASIFAAVFIAECGVGA